MNILKITNYSPEIALQMELSGYSDEQSVNKFLDYAMNTLGCMDDEGCTDLPSLVNALSTIGIETKVYDDIDKDYAIFPVVLAFEAILEAHYAEMESSSNEVTVNEKDLDDSISVKKSLFEINNRASQKLTLLLLDMDKNDQNKNPLEDILAILLESNRL